MRRREAQHGAQEGDFRPRYPAGTAESWLPAICLEDSTQGNKALEAMRRAAPCHMRQTPLVSGIQNRWTLQYLAS